MIVRDRVGDGSGDSHSPLAVQGDDEQFAIHPDRPVAGDIAIGFAVSGDFDVHLELQSWKWWLDPGLQDEWTVADDLAQNAFPALLWLRGSLVRLL